MKRYFLAYSCRRTKHDLIKQIPASVVVGQRNCIKHIWGMEPIWLMDVGYDIVLEDSAVRPSDATAAQISTNHYCLIIEHRLIRPMRRRKACQGKGRRRALCE